MNLLNNDVLIHIFGFIEPNELAKNACRVSKQWQACALKILKLFIKEHPKTPLEKYTYLEFLKAPGGIKQLNLTKLPLTNSHVEKLTVFQELESLNLIRAKKITDIAPLGKLTNLQSLKISYTGVTDLSPLLTLPNLRYLELVGCKIDSIPQFPERCKIITRGTLKKMQNVPLREVKNLDAILKSFKQNK